MYWSIIKSVQSVVASKLYEGHQEIEIQTPGLRTKNSLVKRGAGSLAGVINMTYPDRQNSHSIDYAAV